MRTLLATLTALTVLFTTVLFTGCRDRAPLTPLSIYIVSQEEIEGGQFIDTQGFPKLGYIGSTPDLAITKLEAVGTNTSGQPGQPRPGVVIMLRAEDAQSFSSLSEKAVMKKVLFMIGGTPLTALTVVSPLPASQTRSLQLTLMNQADQARIENELRKLTR